MSSQSIAEGKKLVGDEEGNQCGENGTGILKTLAASGRFPDGGAGTRGPTQELGSYILGLISWGVESLQSLGSSLM